MKIIFLVLLMISSISAYDTDTEYGKALERQINKIKKHTNYVEPMALKEELDFKKKGDKIYILDIRESHEVKKEGRIETEDYVNIPRGLVEFKIQNNIVGLDSNIVVVCYSELRSLFTSERLTQLGYKNIRVLHGGMERWNEECLPKDQLNNFFFKEDKKTSCGGEKSESGAVFFRRDIMKSKDGE